MRASRHGRDAHILELSLIQKRELGMHLPAETPSLECGNEASDSVADTIGLGGAGPERLKVNNSHLRFSFHQKTDRSVYCSVQTCLLESSHELRGVRTMTMRTFGEVASASPARQRLVDTATRLFYAEGIHSVGIDRIIAEAGVAKATFYNHFPSKDDLVLAYIVDQDRIGREAVAALPERSPREMIAAVLGRIGRAVVAGNWRGCPFLNAAAEYPDPDSRVRQAIDARRAWYHGVLRDLLAADGDPTPEVTASLLVALSDGLLESAYLDDPGPVAALIEAALQRMLLPR